MQSILNWNWPSWASEFVFGREWAVRQLPRCGGHTQCARCVRAIVQVLSWSWGSAGMSLPPPVPPLTGCAFPRASTEWGHRRVWKTLEPAMQGTWATMSIASKDKQGHSVPLRLCLHSRPCQVLGLIADDINPASHGHGGSHPGLFLTCSVPLSSDCLHFYHPQYTGVSRDKEQSWGPLFSGVCLCYGFGKHPSEAVLKSWSLHEVLLGAGEAFRRRAKHWLFLGRSKASSLLSIFLPLLWLAMALIICPVDHWHWPLILASAHLPPPLANSHISVEMSSPSLFYPPFLVSL